jgi:hypothetical protein
LLSDNFTVAGDSANPSYLTDFIELITLRRGIPRQPSGKMQRFSVGMLYTPPFDSARIVFQAFDS